MTQENGQQKPDVGGGFTESALERLKGSVREYVRPFEPVGVEDWEALYFEDGSATPRGDA
ncbi:hypothetical protein [Vreelandella rituensis]|uniref:hypothetical protein n=1 Tax=Vreelandella rituensis TaxID=2282306 RepID=UPI0011C01776|nr:hypothetical protein [Halomonas rituensis]